MTLLVGGPCHGQHVDFKGDEFHVETLDAPMEFRFRAERPIDPPLITTHRYRRTLSGYMAFYDCREWNGAWL
jgi:hypothetical protein